MTARPDVTATSAEPRLVKVVVTHLNDSDLRFVVSTFDAPKLSALSFEQSMRFGALLKRMHVGGADLDLIRVFWNGLTAAERSALVLQVHEFELARLRRARSARPAQRPRRRLRLVVAQQIGGTR